MRRSLAIATGSALVLTAAACSGSSSSENSTSSTSTSASAAPTPSIAEKTAHMSLIFGPNNVFRQDISKAPLDPESKAQMKNLMGQITPNYSGQVAFNAYRFNSSMFVADAKTKRVKVNFNNCQKKPSTPDGLFNGPKYFVDVPIPENAKPSTGTDKALAIWDPTTDKFWEFWIAERNPKNKQWSACWGGRIDNVSKASRGTFAFPYGTSASGLATVGSTITIAEAKALKIEHAMQLFLIYTKAGQTVYPANRNDGLSTEPGAIALGTRLRLPASVDVEKLEITPLAKAVARAAQKYGFMVNETAGAVAVGAESPNSYVAAGKPDPWPGIFKGVADYDILKGFPWDKLEVVQHGYGAPAGEKKVWEQWK